MVSTPTGTRISLTQVKEFISGASFQDMKEILLLLIAFILLIILLDIKYINISIIYLIIKIINYK